MKRKKLKIAITGNIGSGKSTFTGYLASKGFPIINADDLSKEILANDPGVKSKIISEFGKEAYHKNGVNTKFLAEKVFSDKQKLQKINSILQPAVIKKTNLLCEQFLQNSNIVFVEAALIFESKIEKQFDYVVVIAADSQIRKNRSITRGSFSAEQFDLRDSNQIDQELKIKKADFVFYNNDPVPQLHKKADLFLLTLNSLITN